MLRKHFKDSSDVLNKALIVPATAKWQQKGFKCGVLPCFRSTLTQSPESIVPLPHVRESETVLDSGFHAVDSGFQEQISALSVERGFRISVLRRIPDSKAHWLRFRIQQAKTSWILESGFPYVGRVVVLQPCFRSN